MLAFPSYLRHLALVARDELGFDVRDLKVRMLASHIGVEDRKTIEELWGAPCYDSYGTHENGTIASECKLQNGMHVNDDAFVIEIVDPETGAVVPDGKRGTTYITTLFRHGAPQIRFNINDVSSYMTGGDCPCGCSFRRLTKIYGRNDNMVKVRGVNVFTEAIGVAVAEDRRSNGEFFCVVERLGESGREELTVMVEVPELAEHGARREGGPGAAAQGGDRPAHDSRAGRRARSRSADRAFADLEDQTAIGQAQGDLMGVQTLDRAIGVLNCLGHAGEQGMRLIDLQRALRLKRPTVHRILASLIEHGLAAYDEGSRTYRLGWETAVLGWSAARGGHDLREVAQGAMHRLAEETGETAVLCACSRLDLVCIDRKTGDYPIKVFTVEIGTRRPLGVGAGSIAVLAAMPEDDALAALDALQGPLRAYPEALRRGIVPAMRAARKAGYAVSDGLMLPNVRGVGVAIRDPRGMTIGSLGVASIAERASDERVAEFAAMLLREQARIERALRDKTSGRAKTATVRRPAAARAATATDR